MTTKEFISRTLLIFLILLLVGTDDEIDEEVSVGLKLLICATVDEIQIQGYGQIASTKTVKTKLFSTVT